MSEYNEAPWIIATEITEEDIRRTVRLRDGNEDTASITALAERVEHFRALGRTVVDAYRYGFPPPGDRSDTGWGRSEEGVSVICLLGEKSPEEHTYGVFSDRPIFRVRGYFIPGRGGSDGEPLLGGCVVVEE